MKTSPAAVPRTDEGADSKASAFGGSVAETDDSTRSSVPDDASHSLLEAAERGDLRRVVNLLAEDDCHCNEQNPFGYTALMLACDFGHTNVAFALLADDRVDVNVRNNYGETALYCAAVNDRSHIVKHLLAKPSIRVNEQDTQSQFRWTALHAACKRGSYECVQLLLEHPDTNSHIFDAAGRTALELVPNTHPHIHDAILEFARQREKLSEAELQLMWAARKGETMEVKRLVKEKEIDINTRFALQRTPLHLACKYNHHDLVEHLTNHPHIEINAQDHHNWTPLHWATHDHDRNLPAVKLLMDHRDTDLHVTNHNNQKAVDLVHEDSPVADHILSNGGADHATTENCSTHQYLRAAKTGNLDKIKDLICKRQITDLTITFKNEQTALHLACRHGEMTVIKYLVEKTIFRDHLSLQDSHGRTPLLEASRWPGNADIVSYLMTKMMPEEIHLADVNDNTPLQVALLCHNMEVAKVLLTHDEVGVDIRKYLHWAAQMGNVEAVDLLTHHATGQMPRDNGNHQMLSRSYSTRSIKSRQLSTWSWNPFSLESNVISLLASFSIRAAPVSVVTKLAMWLSSFAYSTSSSLVKSFWFRPVGTQDASLSSKVATIDDDESISTVVLETEFSNLHSKYKALKEKMSSLEHGMERMQTRLNSKRNLFVEE